MKSCLRLACVIFSIFALVSCSSNIEKNVSIVEQLKQEMDKKNIHYGEIYHTEVIKDGLLVFYKNPEQNTINTGFLRQTSEGWKWVDGRGGGSLNPDGADLHGSYSDEVSLTWLSGVITNPEIEQIITRKPDGTREKTAKIVKTQEGIKIWFVFYKQPINSPIKFIALDEQGNEILQR